MIRLTQVRYLTQPRSVATHGNAAEPRLTTSGRVFWKLGEVVGLFQSQLPS